MQAVKSAKTGLERRLFAMLAGMGLKGWRKNAVDLLGKPDVAFDQQRVAIFVDGCFWHRCPVCKRKLPKTNREYWERKLERNVRLARDANRRLRREGWLVVRCWEHELRNPNGRVGFREGVRSALSERRKHRDAGARKKGRGRVSSPP